MRIASDFAIAAIFALHFTSWGIRHIKVLPLAWLLVPQLAIAYMIYAAGGFGSTYYAGLNLAILAMGFVMPFTVVESIILAVLTLCLYLTAGLVHTGPSADPGLVYNNVYFMIITAVISAIAVYFNRRRRYTEFRLNYELNLRNRDLAELDRVKSEFFANISHEFRTPLTLILAPLERLLEAERRLPAGVAESLDLIRQNGLRLLRLVNDLLDVIRLEEAKVELDRRPLRLDTLIDGAVHAMKQLAQTRGIALENRPARSPIYISGDRSALEKILFNVIGNSLKFTNEGGTVHVSVDVGDGTAMVAVEDTGIGISSAHLPYMFARFRQGDSSATRKYAGTGLGLALVKEFAERHGGSVSVTSELGRGTCVRISLPTLTEPEIGQVEPDRDPPPSLNSSDWFDAATSQYALSAKTSAIHGDVAGHGSGKTVLVIDDEPDMRRYLVDLLAEEYRVLVATNGVEGLEMTRRHRPDMLVLDLMLPEIDGLEVCRQIKHDPDLWSTRIVLLTARAEEPTKLMALRNGADDFLTKPFSSIEVQTRLRNLARSVDLEADLRRRHAELQATVGELRETQHQLIHSEKLNALGRLSAGLLHEINNPLNYTLTALEFARNDPAVANEPDLSETLADVDDGMQRIRGIVKELRAFAYPSKNENVVFDLESSIRAAHQILSHDRGDISVNIETEDGLSVMGSQNHVTQVIVNLLSNAFKALRSMSEQRPGQVKIVACRHAGRVLVAVRDNGPGIEEPARERIFDPFYTTADVGQGMGMGLSVCQTIVNNHGGRLRVDSQPGAWTEFVFDLTPAAVDTDGSAEPDRQTAAASR
ncbi:ATP-binding protein [Salinisphaera sp. T31B1]|uniref:ATP-binding protein n=1 Tax=Salinisphaera sp. T31B1 TaxID=727963 RepID=UPI0033410DC4